MCEPVYTESQTILCSVYTHRLTHARSSCAHKLAVPVVKRPRRALLQRVRGEELPAVGGGAVRAAELLARLVHRAALVRVRARVRFGFGLRVRVKG